MKTTPSASRDLLKLCCRALLEKKAEDLRVLDVGAESSITDYLILATATSEPHLRALRGELEMALKASQTRLVGLEAAEQSGWTVVDAFDVIVHLFLPEQREHYGLERLWKDAQDVSVNDLLDIAPPAPVAPVVPKPAPQKKKSAPAKKAPAKKPAKKKPAAAAKKAAPKKSAVVKKPAAQKKPAAKKKTATKKKPAGPKSKTSGRTAKRRA